MKEEIVYFELNNWMPGSDYPDDEPFILWMSDDFNIAFSNEQWVKDNRLCVVETIVDMSSNYCITTTKDWVLNNCPSLLTDYKQFLRFKDKFSDIYIYGRFGCKFLEYTEENIGVEFRLDKDEEY